MAKIATQPYKGARDFYPDQKRLQKWIFSTWRKVVETYGYEEYDAPILEPTDLYLMKGNEEIIKEQTYTFKDRGDRSVTIRTEMTPTVSRMVAARRQELAYPVRWYSIPNLWRYERMQRGRLREFWQLNVDVFGIQGIDAEFELLQIMDSIFQAFSAKRSSYVIKVNSRLLVQAILEQIAGVTGDKATEVIRLIDRKAKMPAKDFTTALTQLITDKTKVEQLEKVLEVKSITDLPEAVRSLPAASEIVELMQVCRQAGLSNVVFDCTLMRGFDYYTDIVFEAFDTDPENSRALMGGGRYDGLVGMFGAEPVPTVGFAIGDVGFTNFLETHKLIPELPTATEVILLVQEKNNLQDVRRTAAELREMGVAVAVDYSGRKLDKQFKSALKTSVPYLLFIEDTAELTPKYVLKATKNGKEERHSLQRVVSIVKDARRRSSTELL